MSLMVHKLIIFQWKLIFCQMHKLKWWNLSPPSFSCYTELTPLERSGMLSHSLPAGTLEFFLHATTYVCSDCTCCLGIMATMPSIIALSWLQISDSQLSLQHIHTWPCRISIIHAVKIWFGTPALAALLMPLYYEKYVAQSKQVSVPAPPAFYRARSA